MRIVRIFCQCDLLILHLRPYLIDLSFIFLFAGNILTAMCYDGVEMMEKEIRENRAAASVHAQTRDSEEEEEEEGAGGGGGEQTSSSLGFSLCSYALPVQMLRLLVHGDYTCDSTSAYPTSGDTGDADFNDNDNDNDDNDDNDDTGDDIHDDTPVAGGVAAGRRGGALKRSSSEPQRETQQRQTQQRQSEGRRRGLVRRYCSRRVGKTVERLCIDLEHEGRPAGALLEVRRGLRDNDVQVTSHLSLSLSLSLSHSHSP
jgi:hypothetical protein